MADLLVGRSKTGLAVLARLAETVEVSLYGGPAAAGVPPGTIEVAGVLTALVAVTTLETIFMFRT